MEEQNLQSEFVQPQPLPAPVIDPHNELMPPKARFNKDKILMVVAGLALVVVGVLIFTQTSLRDKIPFLGMSNQKVAETAIKFLNDNSGTYLNGQTATLGTVSEQSGLVKFQTNIGGKDYDSYATHDGTLLFPNAIQLVAGGAGNNQQPTAQAVDVSKVSLAGAPYIGDVNAKVVMAFWSDYQCPFCKKAVEENFPQLTKEYVATGKLKIVFKDYAFLGADSQTLGKFSRAVWETAPTKFGAWHQAMFDNQGQENTGWATEAKIMEISTKAIGLTDAKKALALFKKNGDAYQKLMDADKAEGTSFGITGTPGTIIGTKFINGADSYANFKAAVEAALNKQ